MKSIDNIVTGVFSEHHFSMAVRESQKLAKVFQSKVRPVHVIETMGFNPFYPRETEESRLEALQKFKDDIDKLWPIIKEGQSDSASFDNALELLVLGGYSIAEAMLIMIPEAWQNNDLMDDKLKSFYEYHAPLMEPWDGPANIAFTDGKQIGAMLDRNGLRPARYLITNDNKVIFASEMGLIPVEEEKIISKWRLQPGKMLLIDLEKKSIIDDHEIKKDISEKNKFVLISQRVFPLLEIVTFT